MTDKKTPRLVQPQAQTIAIIGMAMVVAVIIGALYLAQATVTATTGSQIQDLSATRDSLQIANEDTIAQIAVAKNLDLLRGRAQALGFQPLDPSRQEYVVVDGYVPNRATATPQITPVPTYIYDETFNGWAKKQWDTLVKQFEAWMGRDKVTPTPKS